MDFDRDRFNRLLGILSAETLGRLARTHVVIAGVGGSGGQIALDLARTGVGFLTLADFDVYERHNMNRQIGCFESTLGEAKVDVIARLCRDVNPKIQLRILHEGVNDQSLSGLFRPEGFPKAALTIETIDILGVRAKIGLYREARRADVIVMTAPMLGFGSALFVFKPDSPPFEEVLSDGEHLAFQRLVPHLGSYVDRRQSENCVKGEATTPTCVVGATLASALMMSALMRLVTLGAEHVAAAPEYIYVDLFDLKFVRGRLDLSSLGVPGSAGIESTA